MPTKKNATGNVAAHKQTRHLIESLIIPGHEKRKETPEFKASKKRLKQDGHYRCYVCGSTKKIQIHHYGGEWCLENIIDFAKLKRFLEEWDVYGYGRLLRNIPLTTVDDVRNLMALCQEHHTGGTADGFANGIHNITFPAWIAQAIAKDGVEPIPASGGQDASQTSGEDEVSE